jgi:hypothetical protein
MRPVLAPLTRASLGALSLLVLAGCSGHDHDFDRGPVSSYYVNAIAVADLDGNGRRDILGLVSLATDGVSDPSYVTTRLQDSTGGFAMPVRFGVGRGPANLLVVDLNGDGRPDLVVPNADDRTVSVRLADPAKPGFFLPALILSTPGRIPLDVAVGDLNGDGKLDLAVAASGANSVLVFTQTATGTFNAPVTYAVGGDPQALTIADLDSNGRADLAVATTANTVSVLLQTGAGTFASAVDYVTGVQPVAIKAADLNGDGKLDLLTANFGAATTPGTQGLSVLLQGAAGTFAAPVSYTTAYRPSGLAVGDLNGDGRLDVAVACQGLPGDPGAVSVLLQSPTTPGTLLAAVDYRGVSGPMGVALADMDGDGRPDLVLADGDIVVRLGSGTGTFGPPNFFYN